MNVVNEACFVVSYVAGGMMTDGRFASIAQAKRGSDVGRWYPIDAGFRSEDGRTLILIDAAEKHWDAAKSKAAADSANDMRQWLSAHPARAILGLGLREEG